MFVYNIKKAVLIRLSTLALYAALTATGVPAHKFLSYEFWIGVWAGSSYIVAKAAFKS